MKNAFMSLGIAALAMVCLENSGHTRPGLGFGGSAKEPSVIQSTFEIFSLVSSYEKQTHSDAEDRSFLKSLCPRVQVFIPRYPSSGIRTDQGKSQGQVMLASYVWNTFVD